MWDICDVKGMHTTEEDEAEDVLETGWIRKPH